MTAYYGPNPIRRASVEVPSHSSNGTYVVSLDPVDGVPVACTCRGYQYRRHCRHLSETAGRKPRLTLGLASPAPVGPISGMTAEQRAKAIDWISDLYA